MNKLNVAYHRDQGQQTFSLLTIKTEELNGMNIAQLKETVLQKLHQINWLPSDFTAFPDLLVYPLEPQLRLEDVLSWSPTFIEQIRNNAQLTDDGQELNEIFPSGPAAGHVQIVAFRPTYFSSSDSPKGGASTSHDSSSGKEASLDSVPTEVEEKSEYAPSPLREVSEAPSVPLHQDTTEDANVFDIPLHHPEEPAAQPEQEEPVAPRRTRKRKVVEKTEATPAASTRKRKVVDEAEAAPVASTSSKKGKKSVRGYDEQSNGYMFGSPPDLEFKVGSKKCGCASNLPKLSVKVERAIREHTSIRHWWLVTHAQSQADLPTPQKMDEWAFVKTMQEFTLAACTDDNDQANNAVNISTFADHIPFLRILFEKAKALQAFTLSYFQSDSTIPMPACPIQLAVLSIRHSSINQHDLACLLRSSAHSIRTLSLSLYQPFLDGLSLAPILRQLPYLKELCLELYLETDNTHFTEHGAEAIFSNCPSLCRFSLLYSGHGVIPTSVLDNMVSASEAFRRELERIDFTALDMKGSNADRWLKLTQAMAFPNLAVVSTPSFKLKSAKQLKAACKKRAIEVIDKESYEDSVNGEYVGK